MCLNVHSIFGVPSSMQQVASLKLIWECISFVRFATEVDVFFGGVNIKVHKELLKNEPRSCRWNTVEDISSGYR